jgi:hypothetical protein
MNSVLIPHLQRRVDHSLPIRDISISFPVSHSMQHSRPHGKPLLSLSKPDCSMADPYAFPTFDLAQSGPKLLMKELDCVGLGNTPGMDRYNGHGCFVW